MKVENRRPLVITGSPFSGASIAADVLFRSGLDIGERLNPPNLSDAAGFFTDADFVEFHGKILDAGRVDLARPSTWGGIRMGEAHTEEADGLVRRRCAKRGPWGWKDPRTVLFLEPWNERLPDARWVFVYRDPAFAAWSMITRPAAEEMAPTPLRRARMALRVWSEYNRRIVAFVRDAGDRSLLLKAPDDFSDDGAEALGRVLRERWGYELGAIDYRDVFRPHLIKKRAPRWLRLLAGADPACRRTREDLEGLRRKAWTMHGDGCPSGPPANDKAEGAPVIALALRKEFEYTQTFVQNHIQRMPADVRLIVGDGTRTKVDDGFPLLTPIERVRGALNSAFRVDNRPLRDRALGRHLRRSGIRAVLAEFGTAGAEVAEACRKAGVPLVVHFHGYDAYAAAWVDRYIEEYRRMFESAAAIVVVSRDMERRLIELGAPAGKIYWNPCGVDPEMFAEADPAAAPPHFLSVGRFVDKKAPYVTLLAFREALEQVPEARLTMMGEGPLRESSMDLRAALGLSDRVEFLGAHSHAEVRAAMRRVRAFVQHSRVTGSGDSEGTPVAVLEAGASGLPVVSSRHAGIKDAVVHGVTGFLVEEGDFRGMGAHMATLAKDPELAASMGRKAREHVSEVYSMDRRMGNLWGVVKAAMEGRTFRDV